MTAALRLRPPLASWSAEHVFVSPGAMSDAFLIDVAAPFLKQLEGAGDWFFIRYGEGGPHLRIRVRVEHDDVAARIRRHWCEAAPAYVDTDDVPGDVRRIAYEPEIARYGGPQAMPLSERVFCRSTALSLGIIAATPGDMERRIGQAIAIIIASSRSLSNDPVDIRRILADHAAGWERWFATVGWSVTSEAAPVALRDPAAVKAALLAPAQPRSYGAAWQACLAALLDDLRAQHPPPPGAAGAEGIVRSHLHMFCNRLGVSPATEYHLARAIGGLTDNRR
jgi:thiopeptide-type bacteriocin biosynthesis protein